MMAAAPRAGLSDQRLLTAALPFRAAFPRAGKRDTDVRGGLGNQAVIGESGERVDLEQLWTVCRSIIRSIRVESRQPRTSKAFSMVLNVLAGRLVEIGVEVVRVVAARISPHSHTSRTGRTWITGSWPRIPTVTSPSSRRSSITRPKSETARGNTFLRDSTVSQRATPMLLPSASGLSTSGGSSWSCRPSAGRTRLTRGAVGSPAACHFSSSRPCRCRFARPRTRFPQRPGRDFEDFLRRPPRTGHEGQGTRRRPARRGGQVVRRDVRFGDHVPQGADRGGNRSAAGKADLSLGRGPRAAR